MIGKPQKKLRITMLCVAIVTLWITLDPRSFANLWLTPDQQGWLWFQHRDFERAASTFENPRWNAMSKYAAQDFEDAALGFSQYSDAEALLARGNALAHAREYLPARTVYLELQSRFPEHPGPAINLPIVQRLIDENRELSQSQQAEPGDLRSEQEEGPESSEGDERIALGEQEQYSAEELAENPELTQMWLRQVQRNPSEFLATKFYRQLQRREGDGS